MLVVAVATEIEIQPLKRFLESAAHANPLVTGMGPVATAVNMSHFLALHGTAVAGVLNIGVAGAYGAGGLSLLDICLARQEVLGDFGICTQDGILGFDPGVAQAGAPLVSHNDLRAGTEKVLRQNNVAYRLEKFVTVNCCSGTAKRGDYLQKRHNAGCENMEGAAVAMVCEKFAVPWVELRCISNMVEDRNVKNWRVREAVEKVCDAARIIIQDHEETGWV